MGSETRVVLNLVLDHGPILQPNGDLGRHFPGILCREFAVRMGRDFLQPRLYIGLDDAVWLELGRRHIAIDKSDRKQSAV
jgi:hypothetical protein